MSEEKKYIKKIYKRKSQINLALNRISKEINNDYKNEEDILFIVIMKGGIFFAIDLLKKIKIPSKMDFIFSSSYNQKSKIGKPIVNYLETINPKNQNVILIDDLIDTGETLNNIVKIISDKKPKSIAVATIFDNEKWNHKNIKKYCAFETKENYFLIGYGLDYEEKFRNLNYISIIK